MNNRHSIRLKGYDYAQEGAYFITINVKERKQSFFGSVENGKVILNGAGKIVHEEWQKTSVIRKNVMLDEFVVMPDHFHAILFITQNETGRLQNAHTKQLVGASRWLSGRIRPKEDEDRIEFVSPRQTIGAIVRGFKGACTKRFLEKGFLDIIWQRNYYDRIIRNHEEFQNFQQYIINNPANW